MQMRIQATQQRKKMEKEDSRCLYKRRIKEVFLSMQFERLHWLLKQLREKDNLQAFLLLQEMK